MVTIRTIKERKLAQWALAYAAGAWALLQVADLVGEWFGWPETWLRALIVVLAVGFVAALVLAWYHGEQGRQRVSTVELGMLTALLVLAGAGVAWVDATAVGEGSPTWVDVGGASGATPTREPGAPAPEQGSIAVLPFADLSPEGDQEYFSDGITEELLNVLAQLEELRVASRTSAFTFKGSDADIDSIARALNVRHVLEGSVRKAGDRVRITAQLIDASSGYHMWSETYDRNLEDVFAVQDEISRAIVSELKLRLSGVDGPLVKSQTKDPEAHTLLLRARQIVNQGTSEALGRAEELLAQAINRDPGYADAHAEMARVHEAQAYYGYAPKAGAVEQARADARRALGIDSTQARAHYILSLIASDYEWDWAAAEHHVAEAVRHNPGFSKAHAMRGWLLLRLGRTEEGLAAARRALELDPVDPSTITNVAVTEVNSGNLSDGIALAESGVGLSPGNPVALTNLAVFYAQAGRDADAIRAARAAVEAAPEYGNTGATLAYTLAAAGRREEAERALQEVMETRPDLSPYLQAAVYAELGERERTLALLEEAVEERDVLAPDLGIDFTFRDYLDEPRVQRLLREMGLR